MLTTVNKCWMILVLLGILIIYIELFIIYVFFEFGRVKFIDNTYINSNSHPVEIVGNRRPTHSYPAAVSTYLCKLPTNKFVFPDTINYIKYYICIINSHEQKRDNSIGIWGNNTNIMRLYYEVTPQPIFTSIVLCVWSLYHCCIYWNHLKEMIWRKKYIWYGICDWIFCKKFSWNFSEPKKLSVGYCNTIACLSTSARLLCQIKTDLYFHYFMKVPQRVKSCSSQQYGQTDVHNNANICS